MSTVSASPRLRHSLLALVTALGLSACASQAPAPAKQAGQPLLSGEILHILHTVNNGEIKQAGQALQKSENPYVLYLAQLIVQDHMALNQHIAKVAQTSGARIEDSVVSRSIHTQSMEALEIGARSMGRSFDCIYLQQQIDQHAMTLKTMRDQLLPSATAPEIKELLLASAPRIEHHMKAAQDYQIGLQCPRS